MINVGNINEKCHDRASELYMCLRVINKAALEILLNETVKLYKLI
jgi:hypothetical protein